MITSLNQLFCGLIEYSFLIIQFILNVLRSFFFHLKKYIKQYQSLFGGYISNFLKVYVFNIHITFIVITF
jgi:hypothetical protein